MDLAISAAAVAFLAVLAALALQMAAYYAKRTALFRRSVEGERASLNARIAMILEQRTFEREKSELSWSGFRKFKVAAKIAEAPGVFSFHLAPHDGKPLPPFQPGQYLTFQLKIDGQDKPVIRCYSLSDGPARRDRYRVTIKKLLPPTGQAGAPGLASSFFHDTIREGYILDVKAPGGKFFLDLARQTPVVLIGGGIGLTPVLSMLNAIVDSGSKRETWFFLGVRNGKEVVMREHLERVAREHENVRLHVCYSDPLPGDIKDPARHHAEHVSVDLFKKLLPSSNYEYYLCGPGPMMTSVTAGLKSWGVPESAVFFESFGAATVKKLAGTPSSAGIAVPVEFLRSHKKASWKPGVGSLLELAAGCGVAIESGCRAGNCGTCLVAIKAGEVSHLTEPGFKAEKGSCLTCVTVPAGPLVLDA